MTHYKLCRHLGALENTCLSACREWLIHIKILSVFPFVTAGEILKPSWQAEITPFTPGSSRHASAACQACHKAHQRVPSHPSFNICLIKLVSPTPRAHSWTFSRRKTHPATKANPSHQKCPLKASFQSPTHGQFFEVVWFVTKTMK